MFKKLLLSCLITTTILNQVAWVQTAQLETGKPDIVITQQKADDLELLKKIKPLFFEADNSANPKRDVYTQAVTNYGGQEVIMLTQDDTRISGLYFKRPEAPVNIIYIPGYFFDLTPSKEWAAPFAPLFPEFNILAIDWRGIGHSEGASGLFKKNAFGKNAYPDIQAAVDFMHKENDKPVILVGFCFGAAMILHATNEAQKTGKRTADALVLNCVFSKFENQFKRAADAEDRVFYGMLLKTGLAQLILEYQANGSLFDVNPIHIIPEIKVPCYFEHYTYDRFAILEEAFDVYNSATCPKMFMKSDQGRHVRIHSKVPAQYREAFLDFLRKFNFIPDPVVSVQPHAGA